MQGFRHLIEAFNYHPKKSVPEFYEGKFTAYMYKKYKEHEIDVWI